MSFKRRRRRTEAGEVMLKRTTLKRASRNSLDVPGDVTWRNKKQRSLKRESRNWLDLPRDVTLLIFMKLGVFEILASAKNVCSSWWKLAKEPLLFREIDFRAAESYVKNRVQFERLAMEAVDRSSGQLAKLSCTDKFYVVHILLHVNCTNSIKSLHFGKDNLMPEADLAAICKGLDSVEELEIWLTYFPDMAIEEVGRTCQKLTSLVLGKRYTMDMSFDQEAMFLVKSLPQLRRLGPILDGCAHLEHLDLQHCSCDQVEKTLLEACATRIRNVIPPDGFTFGYKLVTKRGQRKLNDDIIDTVIEV